MDQSSKKAFVKTVILWNVIFILSMCVLGMFTIYVTNVVIDAKTLIEQISFAASFISIILAIMAMIYAFFQARESSQQNIQVQSSLGKIDEKIKELISIKSEFSALNSAMGEQSKWINNSVEELKHVMEDFKETVEKGPGKDDQDIKRKLKEMEMNLNKIQESKKETESGSYRFKNLYGTTPVDLEDVKINVDGYLSELKKRNKGIVS